MKVDGGIGADLRPRPKEAKEAEAAGYDGSGRSETSHDPFFPLLLGAEHTEHLELGTAIAVAFARNPMTHGQCRLGPPGVLEGPVQPRTRLADQASHREALQHAVVAPGAPDAGVHRRHAGHLGLLATGHQARLSGRLLPAHA